MRRRTQHTQVGDVLVNITLFWNKVDIGTPNECWNWNSDARHAQGFGLFNYRVALTDERKIGTAHRLAYRIANGCALTPDQVVIHTCDNEACCNPRHLKIGGGLADVIAQKRINGTYTNGNGNLAYRHQHPQLGRRYRYTVEQMIYSRYHKAAEWAQHFGLTLHEGKMCKNYSDRRWGYPWLNLIEPNYTKTGKRVGPITFKGVEK